MTDVPEERQAGLRNLAGVVAARVSQRLFKVDSAGI